MVLKAPSPADTVENIKADLELADQLAATEDFADAAHVVALARPLAADNAELRAEVLKRSRSIDVARSAFDQIEPFLDKLKPRPMTARPIWPLEAITVLSWDNGRRGWRTWQRVLTPNTRN